MIFDAHSDIWTDVTCRILKGETNIFKTRHYKNVTEGRISGSIFVIWTEPVYKDNPAKRVNEIIYAIKKELPYCKDVLSIVTTYEEMKKAKNENKFYVFIGFEGLSSVKDNIDTIDEYYDFGARHASLTWNEENSLATGIKGNSERGATSLGEKVVQKMRKKGMILDVSHLNEKSFWDIIDIADFPIIASHSNAKKLCNNVRNLNDEQLKAIRDLNGVVGLNSYKSFIDEDKKKQNIERAIDHIKYMVDKIGIEHVGLGFDYNEYLEIDNFNSDSPFIEGLENSSKSYGIILKLKEAGFNEEEINKIAYENFQRIIKEIIG